MVTLAKALGGGLPTGAIGMSEEVAAVVEDGTVYQVGTYNGNPLGMAAARANLLEVHDPGRLRAPRPAERPDPRRLRRGDRRVRAARLHGRHRLEGLRHVLGGQGDRLREFKDNQDAELSELAWLFNLNRGIFMTPGREEEWTLSVTHTDEAVDHYVAVFREMAAELRA